MRRASVLLALPLLLALLGPRGCLLEGEGQLYLLDPGSVMLDGCFGTCRCPVRLRDLSGSFRLLELPTLAPGPTRLFRVSEVKWRAGSGDSAIAIRGGGLYELDPVGGTQRLLLRLRLAGAPAIEVDSGTLPGGDGFPAIAIRLSENGELACFDTVFELRATPLADPKPECLGDGDCAEGEACLYPTGLCGGAGACIERGGACPLYFDPVCGCDDITYGNTCEATAAGVSIASHGACPGCRDSSECLIDEVCAKPAGECTAVGECAPRPEACLLFYDPVCGCDGNTYGNACEASYGRTSVASEGVCAAR